MTVLSKSTKNHFDGKKDELRLCLNSVRESIRIGVWETDKSFSSYLKDQDYLITFYGSPTRPMNKKMLEFIRAVEFDELNEHYQGFERSTPFLFITETL